MEQRKILEATCDGFLMADTDARILDVNTAYCNMLGYTREALLQMKIPDLEAKETPAGIADRIRQLQQQGSARFQTQHRRKDGSRVDIEVSVSTLKEFGGKMVVFVRDITERKQAELKLQNAEQNLRSTLDGLSAHIAVIDERGQIILTNKAYRDFGRRNGIEPDVVSEGANYLAVLETATGEHSEEADPFAWGIREVLAGNRPSFELEYPCHSPNEKRWFIGRVTPDFGDGARRVIIAHENITERKRAEEALRESELRLSVAIEGTEAGIWDWDMLRDAVHFSDQWKAMLGYESNEIENSFQGWRKLWHPDDVPAIEKAIQDHLKGLTPQYEVINRCRHKDGDWRWIMTRGKILRDADATPARWIGTNIDITAQKQVQEKLVLANERLEAATALAYELAERAEAASRSKSEFLANMSHEIRTPLNGLIGFTDLLRNTALSSAQHLYVENANVSGHALLGIINNILDFSKIEAGMLELETIKTDMVELFENSVDIVKFAGTRKHLEILLNLDPAMPRFAKVDPVRLKQIVANLVSNAIKFTEQGEVELKVQYQPLEAGCGTFSVSIRDTGIGISESQKANLFKAFSQADSSTNRRFGGTGLGLIISDRIAGKMGSKIQIDSTEGEGCTFHFEFSSETEDERARNPGDLSCVTRCLIIDDNANNRMILERMLTGWGIQCESCDNGLDALKILDTANGLDAIICDYHMPDIDGLETIRRIRQQCRGTPEQPPVLLLHSSSDDATLHEQCAELGVQCCITKPVKQEQLFAYLSMLHRAPDREMSACPQARDTIAAFAVEKQTPETTLTVVVAEDVHMNMLLIKSLLARMLPQAKVVEAENGRIALEAYQQTHPDLILMDVQMPEMDGLEATLAIRELEKTTGAHVRIVALTAGAIKEEKARCLDAGMDGFLTKPIELQKLTELFQDMGFGKP